MDEHKNHIMNFGLMQAHTRKTFRSINQTWFVGELDSKNRSASSYFFLDGRSLSNGTKSSPSSFLSRLIRCRISHVWIKNRVEISWHVNPCSQNLRMNRSAGPTVAIFWIFSYRSSMYFSRCSLFICYPFGTCGNSKSSNRLLQST